jgi:iron complex outermembrane receptor protein
MVLIGSASIVAILGVAAPAFAAGDSTSNPTVIVTGLKRSLQQAIAVKRNTVDQVEAISAQDIGKLPDKNVADALQRIVGVNTESAASGEGGFDENDRVSIRGTSPSLTQVTVDGHSIATGDWFILDQFQTVGRSVSFTLLPAEMVQSTIVYKTQDASLLEGGVSGDVDLVTTTPLSFTAPMTFEGSAEAAYNDLSGQTKPQFDGLLSWHDPSDSFGLLAQGFYEDRSIERFGQETLGYTSITSAMPLGAAHPDLVGVQAPTLIGSTLFQQEKKRYGGLFDAEYKNDRVDLNLSGFYSKLDAANVNDNYMYWGSNELNNNLPTSYTVANNTLTSAVWPTTNGAGKAVDGIVVDNIVRPGASAYTSYINLDVTYRATDNLTLKAKVGYTQGEGETDGSPSFEVDAPTGVSFAPSGNGWQVTPTNINPLSPNGLANDWAWNEVFTSVDKETYGQADADWALNKGVFQDVAFGFHASQHTRQVDGWDRGCSLGANGMCWNSPPMPFSATDPVPYPSGFNAGALGIPGLLIPIAGNPNTIVGILNSIKDGVHGPISSIVQPQNYYWPGSFKVQEDDYAGYVMAHVGGEGWKGNFGVRLVETDENAFVNVPDAHGLNPADIKTSAFGDYYVDHVNNDYFDVLPSANFVFDLQQNLLLRVSAAETMSRPDYSALGGTVTLTDLTLTGNGGNPNLRPIRAAVYDAALEWYYAPTAVAAVSVFYDDLSSYVTFGNSSSVYLDQFLSKPGTPVFETYSISSPTNTSGQVKGIEMQVQQPLPYNFGFQANFTYLDGQDATGKALVGTSRITYNLVGYYETKWVSLRLAYTYRSSYFVGLDRGADETQAGYGELDGSLNFYVTPNITFTVDGLNLSNTLLKYYAANPTQVRAVYDNGTQVYAGFHVKF